MMGSFQAVASRLAALSLPPIAVALLWFVAAEPISSWIGANDDKIEDLQRLHQAFQRHASNVERLEAQLVVLGERTSDPKVLWSGTSEAAVGANLLALIKQLVSKNGGKFQSGLTLPAISVSGLRKVAVRVEFQTTNEPLSSILREVESHTPFLFIDALTARTDDRADRSMGYQAPLSVRMDASGFTGAVP